VSFTETRTTSVLFSCTAVGTHTLNTWSLAQGRSGIVKSQSAQEIKSILQGLLDVPPEELEQVLEQLSKEMDGQSSGSAQKRDRSAGGAESSDDEQGAASDRDSKGAPGKAGTKDDSSNKEGPATAASRGGQEDSSQSKSSTSGSSNAGAQGMFGRFLSQITGSSKKGKEAYAPPRSASDDEDDVEEESDDEAASSRTQRRSRGAAPARRLSDAVQKLMEQGSSGGRQRLGRGRGAGDDEDSSSTMINSSGMYLYGCVMLAIHGEVQLDTITTMVSSSAANMLRYLSSWVLYALVLSAPAGL
jgi:hypothetical protein